jgi:hypothetical protein
MTSVLSGKALGGATVVHAQVGWPGLSASLLTSASDKLDAGGKISLLYAYEGISWIQAPGIKLQGVLRLELIDRGKINLGLRFSPGIFFYSFRYLFQSWSEVGFALPVDLAFGFALSPRLMLNVGLDVPMFWAFGPWGGLAVPVLFGAGVEYELDRQLALTANLRAGPSVPMMGNAYSYSYPFYAGAYLCRDASGWYECYNAYPAMEALIGLSIKL